jgi:hypothetical protein
MPVSARLTRSVSRRLRQTPLVKRMDQGARVLDLKD